MIDSTLSEIVEFSGVSTEKHKLMMLTIIICSGLFLFYPFCLCPLDVMIPGYQMSDFLFSGEYPRHKVTSHFREYSDARMDR